MSTRAPTRSRPSTPRPGSCSVSGKSPREQGHLEALRWGREIGKEIVGAIEDCRDLSHHLEQALVAAGERFVRVAPKLMGASRRGEREPGKSDQIDARAIARAVLREGIERFPAALDRKSTR